MDGHQKRQLASNQGVKIIDCIFDIDGTLADASHRLHFIKDPAYWVAPKVGLVPAKPDWDSFLSDEQVAKDAPIPQTWEVLSSLLKNRYNRIIFITGRSNKTWNMTVDWLLDWRCPVRSSAAQLLRPTPDNPLVIYMRREGDRRESHVVKRELLQQARADGYDPKLVFEDRRSEARMWREEGLLCCHVAEGDY